MALNGAPDGARGDAQRDTSVQQRAASEWKTPQQVRGLPRG